MPKLILKPSLHTAAAQFLQDKPAVSREVFDRLLPDLQARAITITGIESANVVQAVRDRIAELPLGADWDEVKRDVAGKISPWLDETDGSDERSMRRAELLLRSHGYQAYAVTQEQVMAQQRAAFPYAQYQSAGDAKVRPTHAALDGVVMPSDSPFWESHTPPWEPGCRCRKVFLTSDDVKDMQSADAKRPPEARRVLSSDQQQRLETSGILQRVNGKGVPQTINVTPRTGGWSWNPNTLTMDAAALRQRYDAPTWNAFEEWAKATQLDDGRTILDWVNGTPAPTEPTGVPPENSDSTVKPAQASSAATPAAEPILPAPLRAPVSNAIMVKTTASHKADINSAVTAIDQVHDDGDLTPVPIYGRLQHALGMYRYDATGKPVDIAVANDPKAWPALTTVHEVGHLLDHQVLGTAGQFASEASEAFAEFRQVVRQSESIRQISALGPHTRTYFLTDRELWARAYAQYITTRSNHPLLVAQLERVRNGSQPWRQWSDEDFKPIATAIDNLFRAKGWIK